MRKKINLLASGSAIVLLCIGMWRLGVSKRNLSIQGLPETISPSYVPGQVFELEYQQEGRAEIIGSTQTTKIHLNAIVKVFHGFSNHIQLNIQPMSLRYVVNGQNLSKTISEDISKPFEMNQEAHGRIGKIWFLKNTNEMTQAFIRELMARVQIVLSNSGKQTWKVREEDSNGEYFATYKITGADANTIDIEKMIESDQVRLVDGKVSIELATKDGSVRSVSSEQTFDLHQGRNLHANWHHKVMFHSVDSISQKSVAGLNHSNLNSSDFSDADSLGGEQATKRSEKRLQESALGDDDEASLRDRLAELSQLGRNAPSIKKRDAVLKLFAYLSLFPDKSSGFAESLSAASADSAEFSYITGALSQVGHDQAQAGLIQALESCRNDERKEAALIQSLAMVSAPNELSQQKLESLSARDDVLMALGTMAKQLSASEPDRANHIVDLLVDQLNAAQTSQRRISALAGLGNSALASAVSIAELWYADKDPSIRAAALRVTRLVPGDAAIRATMKAVESEEDELVRYEGVKALGYLRRGRDVLRAQAKLYDSEKSALIRGHLIRNLWTGLRNYSDGLQTVRKASESDASPEVRAIAKALIVGVSQSEH